MPIKRVLVILMLCAGQLRTSRPCMSGLNP